MIHAKTEKRGIGHSPIIACKTRRNRLVTVFLAIFFGDLGLHKFYLGKAMWGLVYLFFFWSFIPMVIGIIEGIIYLLMSDKEFENKYS
ncbi:TM2 domain-containing protein [Patescibacteria group bacterium]|nr:TM2 domain-containing protein [Patescibacteria group bacterium]